MAYSTNVAAVHRLLTLICRRRRLLTSILPQYSSDTYANPIDSYPNFLNYMYPSFAGNRCLTTNAESTAAPELGGISAYEILGVSQSSSFAEIKASFRKLAKETHPDLAHSHQSSDASQKFIQILAAYEILSDSNKRAHYDHHLLSRRAFTKRQSKRDPIIYNYNLYESPVKNMEVVEWLKWYRYTINDILSERRVTAGSGYFDILERDFYSAVHAAYYGPDIDSMDLLPDRFEAEERSMHVTPEVLHLVSGRDLFGIVRIAKEHCELSNAYYEKIVSSESGLVQSDDNMNRQFQSHAESNDFQKHFISTDCQSDAYRDLELHVSGRVVAMASRFPPKSHSGTENDDFEDQIYVYLISDEDSSQTDSSIGCRIPIGVIKGLGTNSEEGTCDVYNNVGTKTHAIMKHRTLLVKHLHWYRIGEEVSVCECRCSRARLPPSKFWLFEPRSAMHDIGGWYVETYGKDKKGKTVPAQRYWDGFDTNENYDERLHPAMYLLTLAYRTLDIEEARREKRTIKDKVEAKVSRLYSWFKRAN